MNEDHVNAEIELLKEKIAELGTAQPDGKIGIPFGELYEKTVDIFEVNSNVCSMSEFLFDSVGY